MAASEDTYVHNPRYNYSRHDTRVFAACRPGKQCNDVEEDGAVKKEEVQEWVDFMKKQGIRRVISLLGDDEVRWYEEDLDAAMESAFGGDGRYIRQSLYEPGALAKLKDAFMAAEEAKEPVVVHCSGGCGRASIGICIHLSHVKRLNLAAANSILGQVAFELEAKDIKRKAPGLKNLQAFFKSEHGCLTKK